MAVFTPFYTPIQGLAAPACHYTLFHPPVLNSSCQCSTSLTSGSSCGAYVACHGGYTTCEPCLGSGLSGCTASVQWDYCDSAACQSSINGGALTVCILGIISAGLADSASVAACVSPLGVITWSSGACEEAMLALAAVNGTAIVACLYCNWHDCAADPSTLTPQFVYKDSATGSACGLTLPPCSTSDHIPPASPTQQ
jgi:hypothetical protein